MSDPAARERAHATRRAVILDRDGVINHLHYEPEHGLVDSPLHPDQFQLLPGVAEAICEINAMGLLAVVASNQPAVAKGKCTPRLLQAITDKMVRNLAREGARLEGIFYCLHHPEALVAEYRQDCSCRKPKPGLLLQAGRDLGLDLTASYMIGDGLTDIQAGHQVGCTTIWVGKWKCDVCRLMQAQEALPHFDAQDLLEAVHIVKAREGGHEHLPGYFQHR